MKKIIPIAIIAVFGALTFVSCKKSSSSSNHTCTCTINEGTKDTTIVTTFPSGSYTADSAKSVCNMADSVFKMADSTNHCDFK